MNPLDKHNNFIFFTLSLVALLLASAFGHLLPPSMGKLFSGGLMLVTFAVAYASLSFGAYWHKFVGAILILSLLNNIVGELVKWPHEEIARQSLALAFFLGATINASRQVLLSDDVEANIIVGALAIYLLLGLVWASLYTILLSFYPGAFNGIAPVEGGNNFADALYFSYVTLATLGYGDISPVLPLARTLAYLEAITGTFFLAIVVASLIGGRKQRIRNQPSHQPEDH